MSPSAGCASADWSSAHTTPTPTVTDVFGDVATEFK